MMCCNRKVDSILKWDIDKSRWTQLSVLRIDHHQSSFTTVNQTLSRGLADMPVSRAQSCLPSSYHLPFCEAH